MAKNRVLHLSFPPRHMEDPAARAEWPSLSEEIRRHVVRRFQELEEGEGIWKDRALGRSDRAPGGFYSLTVAERLLYEAEQLKKPAADIDAAKRKVDELREALKDDEAQLEQIVARRAEMDALKEALLPYRKLVMTQYGETLEQYLTFWTEAERLLRTDVLGGIFMVCERIGVDPLQLLAQIAQQPAQPQQQVAH